MSETAITFLASFSPIQSAMKIGQDGARVQFDIPETELPAIARLLLMRGIVLRVTVEPEVSLTKKNNGRTTRQSKQSQWTAAEEPVADSGA